MCKELMKTRFIHLSVHSSGTRENKERNLWSILITTTTGSLQQQHPMPGSHSGHLYPTSHSPPVTSLTMTKEDRWLKGLPSGSTQMSGTLTDNKPRRGRNIRSTRSTWWTGNLFIISLSTKSENVWIKPIGRIFKLYNCWKCYSKQWLFQNNDWCHIFLMGLWNRTAEEVHQNIKYCAISCWE